MTTLLSGLFKVRDEECLLLWVEWCFLLPSAIENAEFKVSQVKRQVTYSKPPAPYTTSTLQQDAIKKLKMTLNSYTKCAQSLYEGVMIEGEGKTPLVTYIRTDSTRVSLDAQFMAKEYILEKEEII